MPDHALPAARWTDAALAFEQLRAPFARRAAPPFAPEDLLPGQLRAAGTPHVIQVGRAVVVVTIAAVGTGDVAVWCGASKANRAPSVSQVARILSSSSLVERGVAVCGAAVWRVEGRDEETMMMASFVTSRGSGAPPPGEGPGKAYGGRARAAVARAAVARARRSRVRRGYQERSRLLKTLQRCLHDVVRMTSPPPARAPLPNRRRARAVPPARRARGEL